VNLARKSLRPQLNQIRAWVRQGRTDAWIAHQLDVPASQLREFRRRHDLSAEGEEPMDADLRDEIEAEIEAELETAEEPGEEAEAVGETEEAERAEGAGEPGAETAAGERGRRRRRRRGRRGRGRRARTLEATFDHGTDGYGMWLDPAVKDDPVYAEHWAGQRALRVTIEPERIVLERAEDAQDAD
jgi:hypothetical protein